MILHLIIVLTTKPLVPFMYSAPTSDVQIYSYSVHTLLPGDLEHFSPPLVDPLSFPRSMAKGADLELP